MLEQLGTEDFAARFDDESFVQTYQVMTSCDKATHAASALFQNDVGLSTCQKSASILECVSQFVQASLCPQISIESSKTLRLVFRQSLELPYPEILADGFFETNRGKLVAANLFDVNGPVEKQIADFLSQEEIKQLTPIINAFKVVKELSGLDQDAIVTLVTDDLNHVSLNHWFYP